VAAATGTLLDREDVNAAIAFWMETDAKLDRILRALGEDEDGEERADST
jgi:hypothetical protein